MERIKIIRGNTIKVKIVWSYPSEPTLSLDDINFSVEFMAQGRIRIKKESLSHDEDDWYAYVDSSELGNGNVILRLRAEIPDTEAPEGIKIDISECDTNITIYG